MMQFSARHQMPQIVPSIGAASAFVEKISVAGCAQSSGIDRIRVATKPSVVATQQYAALVEPAVDAAASLREKAPALGDVVASFRTAQQFVAVKN